MKWTETSIGCRWEHVSRLGIYEIILHTQLKDNSISLFLVSFNGNIFGNSKTIYEAKKKAYNHKLNLWVKSLE